VFSDRCTLKNVQIESDNVKVINRYNVAPVVSSICDQITENLLDENLIRNIYAILYPFTQVDKTVKVQHIANIRNKHS
jgi:hypothetical protein